MLDLCYFLCVSAVALWGIGNWFVWGGYVTVTWLLLGWVLSNQTNSFMIVCLLHYFLVFFPFIFQDGKIIHKLDPWLTWVVQHITGTHFSDKWINYRISYIYLPAYICYKHLFRYICRICIYVKTMHFRDHAGGNVIGINCFCYLGTFV